MAPPAPIAALTASTTSQLRSGIVIPSLPAVLLELVQNSLDARASSIQVVLDLERWSIRCDDDGCGLARDDLRRVGQERYWTSKADGGHETFGFRGEALASVGEVAVLEVLTRRDTGDGESYSLLVRDGKVAFEGVARTKRVAGGTTVWARDIFYKWPVRRRPYATPTARASLVTSFRHALSTLSLLHPLVSFSLTETSDDATATGGARRLVGVARSKEGVLGRWRQLWGRAGVENVVEFDHSDDKDELRAEGFFSLTASHSKASQFIFVNNRPVSASPLQKLVNTLFLSSTFSRHTTSHIIAPLPSPSKTSDKDAKESTKASRKSPKKAAERHPIFVLHLTAPPAMVDVTLEPEKRVVEFQDEKRVFAFVEDVVKSFLRAHGFLATPAVRQPSASPSKPPSRIDGNHSEVMVPPQKKQRLDSRPATPVPTVGRAPAYDLPFPDTPPRRHKVPTPTQPELRVFPEADPHSLAPAQPILTTAAAPDQPIRWTDSTTRQTFLIDPRTGNSWRPSECPSCEHEPRPEAAGIENSAPKWDGVIDRTSLRTQARGEGETETVIPDWMRETLQNWENPVFARADAFVPALRPTLPTLIDTTRPTAHQHHHSENLSRTETSTISAFFTAPGSSTLLDAPPTRFLRSSLQRATFIAQVDRKFLLASLDGMLVMVDQHAADERVRVERFLAELVPAEGQVERWTFAEPVPVVVSREEAIVVEERWEEFDRWGVGFETKSGEEGEMDDYRQVYLTSVPLVVADRLKVESRLQQELVRSHVALLAERGCTAAAKGPRPWASVLRECPPVLLDLVNSKACRGAIMFNDSLTPAQGANLLARLAATAFPFQCAHGRPSLIPIVNLPSPSTSSSAAAPAGQRNIDWSLLKP